MSCRVFAECIGGRCWLANTTLARRDNTLAQGSGEQHGTEFRFTLPGHIVEGPQLRELDNSSSSALEKTTEIPSSLRVYVVEDSAMLRRSIASKLRSVVRTVGSEVTVVEHETVESILPTINEFKDDPDVIVTADQNLDAMGGNLRGSDLVTALKLAGFKGLLVSCSGDLEVAQEHLDLGADLVWGKPLPNSGVVLASLQRFYQSRAEKAAATEAPAPRLKKNTASQQHLSKLEH